jgi:diaminopimelate epimerase
MIESIDFVKLSGSGNDFICIDNRDGRFGELISSGRVSHFARTLCRRGPGVGADGLIFAESTDLLPDVQISARFLEPDGSEAELCGNGAACFVSWAVAEGWLPEDEEVKALTTVGVIRGQKLPGQYVRVCIPEPEDMQKDVELEADGKRWRVDYLIAGVPHAVAYVDDVGRVDVAGVGPQIRHHQRFQPRGVNVNFVQILGEGRIAVRTFEFGVEDETLACGTGSAAAAIMVALRHDWPKEYLSGAEPDQITTQGGDVLRVYFTARQDGSVVDVCLETVVRRVYSGSIHPDLLARALDAGRERPKCCRA